MTHWIERLAVSLKLIPELRPLSTESPRVDFTAAPPVDQWDDWCELESAGWPARRTERRYTLVPTTCFNCESACGLLAYVDRETGTIRKFEGNPLHPASRGRLCAKGPATINQIHDPDRILHPLRRVGKRGEGKWEEISWPDALELIAGRIRNALREERRNEIVYHVGRPGNEGYVERVLQAWGVDGHNSHTNICSAGARFGYAIWHAYDRPSPDHANAEFILLISAHLESGHYFNPHAQRIIEGKLSGAKLAVIDPRLSNTASMADYWLPTRPGTEAILLLAIASVLLKERLYDAAFLERWVNWDVYLRRVHPERSVTFDQFLEALTEDYSKYTPEMAAEECGVDAAMVVEVARSIGRAGHRFAAHNWRGPSSAHLGGWQVARCLHFLSVLVGAVGTEGGTSPNAWSKFRPQLFDHPPAPSIWNELHFPKEYPLCHYEMSFLLPHFLKEGRGKLDVYFTRVFNPVWTYPDGFSWIEVLCDESLIGLHVALTPTWNETAFFADLVLPMGHSAERHDLNSYATHSGKWIAFRQPVRRVAAERQGNVTHHTYETNPGLVWEEDEFWIELSWQIDPTGELGIRKHFESPYRPGEKVTVDDYYRYIFERVPGLPEAAAAQGLDPLQYMRRYGAFEVEPHTYRRHERRLTDQERAGLEVQASTGVAMREGKAVGIAQGEDVVEGFPTPSRKQELYSETLADWGWPEYAVPGYIESHVDWRQLDRESGEFCLLPTFRLPTLIHSRSGSAKWLNEIAQNNPVWIHPEDAKRLGIADDDLVRVTTEIGYFVDRVWVTEAIRPGVVACSHHLGRWRRAQDGPNSRLSGNLVEISRTGEGQWRLRRREGPRPFASSDPDTQRIWWRDGGVPQNLTHAVHPDPISGMHCWHQKCCVEPARAEDRYGDVVVDTKKAH
ncbi:MAG TPA: formate dehydrogenase, partial [Planctomycetaceae bacterium]|nr:formate dehydrogenase [Planctomycetaceae bacterium]